MEKQYIVPASTLLKLINKQEILECLQGGGVDSWEGYDFSLEDMEAYELSDLVGRFPEYVSEL